MPDSFESVRSLPFTVLASALGISLEKFKRKGNEWVGPCPYHKPKNNTGCFRYHDDGRYNCFVCLKGFSGRGAIDFTKAMMQIGFQAAVDFLTPYAGKEPPKQNSPHLEANTSGPSQSDVVLKPFTGKYEKFAKPCPWQFARHFEAVGIL
jgi:CHC2 zinc finger